MVIRVLIADDHSLVRSGLSRLIAGAGDLELVGEAANGDDAVIEAKDREPDVVLMDLSMPGTDGVEATRLITSHCPSARVVILTSMSNRERIVEAMDAGAIGYLLKDSDPDDILRAIRSASRGDWPLDPRAARLLLSEPGPRTQVSLSPREAEVLALVAEGLANKQIARRLGITVGTVKAHLTRIFEQLGVADRTQAALWAQRNAPGP